MTRANEKPPRRIYSISFGIEVIEIVTLPKEKPDLHTVNSIIFFGHIHWGPPVATCLCLFWSLFQLCSDTPAFKTPYLQLSIPTSWRQQAIGGLSGLCGWMQSFLMRPCKCVTFIWLEAPLPCSRLGVNVINSRYSGEVFSFEEDVLGNILSRHPLMSWWRRCRSNYWHPWRKTYGGLTKGRWQLLAAIAPPPAARKVFDLKKKKNKKISEIDFRCVTWWD